MLLRCQSTSASDLVDPLIEVLWGISRQKSRCTYKSRGRSVAQGSCPPSDSRLLILKMADEGNLSLDSSKFFCESNESLARKLGVPADTHPDVLQVLLTDYYEQGGSNSDEEEVPR